MTRSSKIKYFLASALLTVFFAVPFAPSFAEDAPAQAEAAAADAVKTDDAKTATVQDPEKMKAYEKAAEKARAALRDISSDIKQETAAKHFYMMYQNYNLIGTVKVVQEDVGNAINQCGVSNAGMKEKLMQRYEDWNNAVTPVVQEAQANVDNMIIAQDYTDPAKIRKAFKALDDARAATNASVDKRPVTSEKACKDLLEKMEDTQKNLVTLLRQTLVSFGRMHPEAAPLSADEAKKKASEKAEPEKEKL